MRGQERSLHETPTAAYSEHYVLATASDKGVEVFRRWLYDHANGGPYFPRASRTLPAPDPMIFDRWQRHAKHCPRCRRVMRTFGSVQSWAGRPSPKLIALKVLKGPLKMLTLLWAPGSTWSMRLGHAQDVTISPLAWPGCLL